VYHGIKSIRKGSLFTTDNGMFAIAATQTAIAHFMPNLFPLLSPAKRAATGFTDFGREIRFFNTTHNDYNK